MKSRVCLVIVFCFCSQKVVFTLFSNFGFKYSFLLFSILFFFCLVIVFHWLWVIFLFIILLLLFSLVNKQSLEPTTHHHRIDQNPTTITSNHPTNHRKPPRHPNKNPAHNPRTKTSKLTTHHQQRQAHLPITGKLATPEPKPASSQPITDNDKLIYPSPTRPTTKSTKAPPLATTNQQNPIPHHQRPQTNKTPPRERERERERSVLSRATLGEREIDLRSVKPRRPPRSQATTTKTTESHVGRGRDRRREQCWVRERERFLMKERIFFLLNSKLEYRITKMKTSKRCS